MMLAKEIEQKEKEMKNYQLNQLNKLQKKLKEKQLIQNFEISKNFNYQNLYFFSINCG